MLSGIKITTLTGLRSVKLDRRYPCDKAGSPMQQPFPAVAPFRVEQWWKFKLVPPLIAVYASCLQAEVSIAAQWRELLSVIIALGSGAAAISVINDLFDRADDSRAGKLNRLEVASDRKIALLLLPHLGIAAVAVWWWRDQPLALALYAATWLVFAFYSIPPIRLKRRGVLGALADAAGANFLPLLLAIVATAPERPDALFLLAAAIWALSFGLRGIVWHQLQDLAGDRRSGVTTFVVAATPERARALVSNLLFPIELAGMLGMIALSGSWAGVAALAFYALTVGKVKRHFGLRAAVISASDGCETLMHDFYLILLPLALLVQSTMRHSSDVVVLLVHVAAFAPALLAYASEIRHWRKR